MLFRSIHLNARIAGLERNIEMRLADQSRLFGDLHCRPHDKAQRIFDQKVVIQAGEIVSVVRHLANPLIAFCFGRGTAKESGTLLLPGAFQTPPARAQADWTLRSVTPAAVRLRLRPEQCCRLQLLHGPITAGTIPSENTVFTTCVDPISPPRFQLVFISDLHPVVVRAEMVEAPGTAPGSALLISQHVYRHSRRTGLLNIGRFALV